MSIEAEINAVLRFASRNTAVRVLNLAARIAETEGATARRHDHSGAYTAGEIARRLRELCDDIAAYPIEKTGDAG